MFMQFTPRYLVNNIVTITANDAGFVTEYRPVYQRQLHVYRGIDNVLQFRLLNADQKPINVATYTPKFVAYDENNNLVIEHDGTINQLDDSSASRGLFTVTVTENDLLNIKQQYLKYNIYIVDSANTKKLTYVDSHFDNNGTIFVDSYAFPGPKNSYNITQFTEELGNAGDDDDNYWISESISAEPAINGNEALHTAAIYSDSYVGDVVVQATLENQVTDNTAWADITTVSLSNETEPTPVNFNGVFSHLRFKTTANPGNTISKILVRN
jgi:hypothetical protein|tara:strand:+ start:1723 stop:2529 length:807 start_codon:yes stop_codon:yes gene_type:complete